MKTYRINKNAERLAQGTGFAPELIYNISLVRLQGRNGRCVALEDFISEKLCPTGKVMAWDETVIRMALDLKDMDTLACRIIALCERAGVQIPACLTLPGTER